MRVVVLSRKGGVGKSTTAIHLGGYLSGVSEGEDSVLLVDTDPSRNALRWAKRGRLPFRVVGEDEVDANPSLAREARHLIVDMRGSPSAEEIEDAMRLAEVMVIPIMPSGLALDTLLQTRRDLRRLGREDRYRVLLTAVPPWPYRRGPQARAQLEELGIPLFGTDIRRLEAFEAVADEGALVRDLPDRRAQRAWEDYERVGEELVEWVRAVRTPDLHAARSGEGVSERASGNRYAWLQDEDDPRVEEALREHTPAPTPAGSGVATPDPRGGHPAAVPGVSRPRKRNRAKNPKALRNDPDRMMAGARIRKDVRRRVEQALADPEVGEGTNYSLLVESLLVRWLDEVGYPMPER